MATLPPRKNMTPTRASKQNSTPLQTLLQMGFPKHRAEKALASTGNAGVHLASDWLLGHVNDPFLDEYQPREYILYACPTGPFLRQLEDFWGKSKEICGWNGAHNYMPHITLVSFFKAPDECSLQLSKALKQIVDSAGAVLDRPLKLELYTSPNFMGFFVAEDDANFLKRLALQYVKEVSNSTISLEPHVKSLHLTLAYQFPSNQFNSLKALVETLNPSCASSWELRLYSRDARLATKQVHKVIFPHTPRETDELELRDGDYIYISNDALENSTDGWVDGISWLTGMDGHLPGNYTERTAESDAWTLHRLIELCNCATPSITFTDEIEVIEAADRTSNGVGDNVVKRNDYDDRGPQAQFYPTEMNSIDETPEMANNANQKNHVFNCDISTTSTTNNDAETTINSSVSPMISDSGGCRDELQESSSNRKIYIMRHGERIDFTFGTWIPYCFDEFGNYLRKDLNMPKSLPKRINCPEGWQCDSPLTNVGVYQAKLVGEGMRESGVTIDSVYCSPSFRCIQTCSSALEGLQLKDRLPINIEPALFEWMTWYQDGTPDWVTKEELAEANYNINHNYNPIMDKDSLDLCIKETCEEFYIRNYEAFEKILRSTTGNIFIVAHAATLDTCTRQLMGREPRCVNELRQAIHKIPYCSLIGVEKCNDEWKFIDTISLPITHSKNPRFEWMNVQA
ncbi:protein UBASH3A homolog isoform X2 [Hermetia illucens]|uniref:protein UBASH3A homolog isoform X2 n=1 Tax=Hermetia illucens TaxID=343691 RepID=UPI0018CC163D|nr:protein UBASH3A homolog isoform X2 [Hermetia illucens]